MPLEIKLISEYLVTAFHTAIDLGSMGSVTVHMLHVVVQLPLAQSSPGATFHVTMVNSPPDLFANGFLTVEFKEPNRGSDGRVLMESSDMIMLAAEMVKLGVAVVALEAEAAVDLLVMGQLFLRLKRLLAGEKWTQVGLRYVYFLHRCITYSSAICDVTADQYKLTLLWGEAQLCLPYVTYASCNIQ